MNANRQNILWVDCLGALIVGVIVLILCRPLARWDGLPLAAVVAMGIANLAFGVYSLYVTTRSPRPLLLVSVLAAANMAWLLVCVAIVGIHWQAITLFGLVHVLGEGIYVASLGYTEWKWRQDLAAASTVTTAPVR